MNAGEQAGGVWLSIGDKGRWGQLHVERVTGREKGMEISTEGKNNRDRDETKNSRRKKKTKKTLGFPILLAGDRRTRRANWLKDSNERKTPRNKLLAPNSKKKRGGVLRGGFETLKEIQSRIL